MAKRQLLMQAHKYKEGKHKLVGQVMSEKIDGMRCFWDSGVSIGLLASEVPWANVAKDKKEVKATGLWSRYGKVIHAPERFLCNYPSFPVDGELYAGRGNFQQVMSTCRKHTPVEAEWQKITYCIFDSPTLESIFYDSEINLPQYQKTFTGILRWIQDRGFSINHHVSGRDDFQTIYSMLRQKLPSLSTLLLHTQIKVRDIEGFNAYCSNIMNNGGEGVVTRKALGHYLPERVHHVNKHKPLLDDEGIVVGYTTGREGKDGKYLGLLGAVEIEWQGKRFLLSGFTGTQDAPKERQLIDIGVEGYTNLHYWAYNNPDSVCPDTIEALHFPRGTAVTFNYRELTDAGIPKEASYFRKHHGV